MRIACPTCGRSLAVAEADAGQLVLCNACGARLQVPVAPRVVEAAADPLEVLAASGGEPRARRAVKPVSAAKIRPRVWVAVAAALVAGVTVTLVATRSGPVPVPVTPPVAVAANADLVQLKGEAEALAIEGRLAEAHAKYRQLQNLAATREIADPAMRQALEVARVDQDRIFARLTEKPTEAAPASQPVEAAPAAPVVVASPVRVAASMPVRPLTLRGPGRSGAVRDDPSSLTDQQVGEAIQRGVGFLLSQYQGAGVVTNGRENSQVMRDGVNALVLYALLQASQSITDDRIDVRGPFVKSAIEKVKSAAMNTDKTGTWQPCVYARALRAAGLAVYNRPEDHQALKDDAAWLVAAEVQGGYTYDDRFGQFLRNKVPLPPSPPGRGGRGGGGGPRGDSGQATEIYAQQRPPGDGPGPRGREGRERESPMELRLNPDEVPWDNSNAQYGLLGVWSCAESGVEIPGFYWKDVEDHWTRWQLKTGEWGYRRGEEAGYLAMTCAGVASLFVTADWGAPSAKVINAGGNPFGKPLADGLGWLEAGDHCLDVGGEMSHYRGYDLYSLERVGLASGFKHLGKHDWYRELAWDTVRRQWPDGSWGAAQVDRDKVVETAYTVLFLVRGRHPVVVSKLRFDGAWADHPRDASNLARFAGRTLERGINWQVVNVDRDHSDWLDSPVLFIASKAPPKLADADLQKLRQYAEAGGLILSQSDGGGGDALGAWVAQTCAKLWPDYALKPLANDDAVYSMNVKIASPRPKLLAVGNGARLLWVHSPADLGSAWQQRAEKSRPEAFGVGLNLMLYASGKAELRNRLSTPYIPAPAAQAERTVKVARLKYAGNWDPEPAGWPRFSRWLQGQTGVAVDAQPVEIAKLSADAGTLAHLTGTAALTLSDDDVKAIGAYVDGGGTLLIDACGGADAFRSSVESDLLAKAFPGTPTKLADADGSPLKGDDGPVRQALRSFAAVRIGDHEAGAAGLRVLRHGKGVVYVSALDLSSGLVGASAWGIYGYTPGAAMGIVRNVVMELGG